MRTFFGVAFGAGGVGLCVTAVALGPPMANKNAPPMPRIMTRDAAATATFTVRSRRGGRVSSRIVITPDRDRPFSVDASDGLLERRGRERADCTGGVGSAPSANGNRAAATSAGDW